MEMQSLMDKGTILLPEAASTLAKEVDLLFYVIFWGSVILFTLMFGIGAYFLIKYRRTESNQKAASQVIHNDKLEIGWTVIPLIVVMIIFIWGYKDYLKLVIPPVNAKEIRVVGKKWLWEFQYVQEGVKSIDTLVVPVGQPIKLIMTATDVIHSFYLPNFRVKKDVLPNKYTRVWFYPEKEGQYQVFCTEYCGDGHSAMLATLKVVSQEEYEKWLKESNADNDLPLVALGEKLYKTQKCFTCHSIDGTPLAGPSWKGIYGQKRDMSDGKSVVADENYISESILNPAAKVVRGYPPVMPTYAGSLSEREIAGIIEYIKTIK